MTLADKAGRLVGVSEKEGASQAEAFAILTRTSSVYIDDDIPKIVDAKEETGVGLKFILGKQIGFTSSTLLSESVEDVVRRAKSMARMSSENPKFRSLPGPKKPTVPFDSFFDAETANADSSVLIENTMDVVKAAKSDSVSVPNGVLRASSVEFHVQNSLGVDTGSKSTMVFGFFTAKAGNSESVGEGVQRCWSRRLHDIDFLGVGEKLKTQALDVLKAKAFKGNWKDTVAVLAPSEGSEMLGMLVGFSTSAENVNHRRSPWTDKVGDSVADKSLTVVDNGLSELGLLSAAVDDEGVPMQSTTIVENGVLKSYVYDSYNAAQVGLESTGNGMKRDSRDAQGSFTTPTSCRPTTLEISAGTKAVEDIISEVDRGVYIEHFAWPLVDPLSGAFSNEIRNAQLIQNGELTTKIRYSLLVGNLFEAIGRELMVGSDLEVHSNYVMPTIALSGIEIVGQ
ncbi:MAG: TldD/PmbA family protein [Candidatus Thorarchaeota archaeon]|jgi:PmbA protein